MRIYSVQAPNGRIYDIEGPDDADPEILKQVAASEVEKDELRELRKEFGPGALGLFTKGVSRGASRLGSTFGDVIPAMIGKGLGFEDYAKEQMEEARAAEERLQMVNPPLYESYKQVEGLGDVPGFVAETLGEQVPNIGTAIVPGVGAAGAATRLGLGAAGRAAATNVGTFLGSYSLNAPEIFQNVYQETGQMEPGVALLFGSASAALDSILPATLAKQLVGPARVGVIEKILERSGMDRGALRGMTAGVLSGMGTEAGTEAAQESISIAAERFVSENEDLWGSKEWNRLMESAVRGAVAGGGFGAVGGGVEGLRAKAEQKRQEAEALELENKRQEAERVREEISGIETEIAQIESRQQQMTLPGMDTEISSGFSPEALQQMEETRLRLSNPQLVAAKAAVDAKNTLKGTQLSLFGEEGKLSKEAEKAATRDQKRAAADAKAAQKKAADELKANQERLKKYLSAKQGVLPGLSKEETDVFEAQTKAQQEARIESGQGDLFEGMPPAKPEPEVTAEAPPSTAIGSDKDSLKAFGKQFGIGPTARILRPDGPLAGKDISKPEDAAEVKRILEAYAAGNPAAGAAAKIEEYLKRPEFQVSEAEVTPSGEPTTEFVDGTAEPSVPTTAPGGVSAEPTEGTGTPDTGGMEAGEPTTVLPDEGKAVVEPTVEETVTEPTAEETPVRSAFVTKVNDRALKLIQKDVKDTLDSLGVGEGAVTLDDFANTEAYDYLRAPELASEYFRLKDVLAVPDEQLTKRDRTKRKKDEAEFAAIEQELVNATNQTFVDGLASMPAERRDNVYAQMRREARSSIIEEVQNNPSLQSVIEERARAATEAGTPGARQEREEVKKGKKPRASRLTEEAQKAFEQDKAIIAAYRAMGVEVTDKEAYRFNQRFYEKTGELLFLPKHRGPDLSPDLRSLVDAGNLKGTIIALGKATQNKDVSKILNKIQGLGLKTKIVVGNVEGNQAGSYDPRTNTITLSPESGMNEHTLLHELMHAAVSHVLRNENLPVSKELISFFNQIRNQFGDAYGGQDIQEFASELFSNPEFQALLKTIKAPKSDSLFKRILQTIAELFGFNTAYKKGMDLINDAIDISADVEPEAADMLFLGNQATQAKGLRAVGEIGRQMPSLSGRVVEGTKNYLSNMPSDVRKLSFGLLRMDNLNTIYGKELPSLQKLIDAIELRAGTQERRIGQVNENYKRFTEVAKANPVAMERMNKMAYDARLEQVDPIDPKFKPTPAQRDAYNRIKQMYDALPKDVQQVYKDIRKEYLDAINEYERILLGQVEDPTTRQKLKAQYETQKRQVAYIPFLRRGDFWVEYDLNGERAVSAFESIRERDEFIKTQLKGKPHKKFRQLEGASYTQGSLPPTSFIATLMKSLNEQGATQEVKDNAYQAYLALFPAQSLAKNFMKSDNIRGMEQDIIRGYGETMIKWARKLASSEYSPKIDRAFAEIREQAKDASDGAAEAADNIIAQSSFVHNPTYGSIVSGLTTFSYFNYIAGNISSALVNLTTLPIFSWSILGARYGYGDASKALFDGSKVAIDYAINQRIPSKYKALFDTLNDHAQLEHTLAREVLEGRRETTGEFLGIKAKVMDLISIPFNKTEVVNRGATAVAAFDLARKKGMSEKDAIRHALNTTKQINTSGLGATAPSYMQHPFGRVLFTFKTFIWNSAFVVARAFHQAAYGKDPAIVREARRQILGIFGMTMAFAGVKGLPFMGAISTLSTMITALFGDEDEPFDLDVEMREFFGELYYKGLVNYVTNLEIANRTGVANDLLFRDDPQGVAENGLVLTAMQQMFGPFGSFIVGAERGTELMMQGEVLRGAEALMPSSLRNVFKAFRFAEEGALTARGQPIIEDISAWNIAMQAFGFSPADLSNAYEEIAAKKGYERDVLARRASLLNKYDMAKKSGDYELLMEVNNDIQEFNQRRIDPEAKITRDTLRRSQAAREAYEENTINGVRFNKNLMPELQRIISE